MSIDSSIEKQILTGLIVDAKFCKQVIPLLKSNPDCIQVPFARDVAGWCADYWNKYHKPPQKHIQHIFQEKQKSLSEENAELISEFLDGLSKQYEKKNENFNADYIFDESVKYFNANGIKTLQKKVSLNLKKGNVDKANKLIADYKSLNLATNNDEIGNVTLPKALDSLIRKASEFEKVELPKKKMLLFPWIQSSDLILVSSDPGVGKTWFALEICAALRGCRRAFGGLWEVPSPARTLFIDGEMHWSTLKERVKFVGLKKGHVLSVLEMELRGVKPPLNLNVAEIRDLLLETIIKNKYRFVVIDNLFSLWTGLNLDDAKEWQESNLWLKTLRSKGVCVMLLHHTNKSGQQMGSISKLYNLDTAIKLKKSKSATNDEGEEICSFRIEVEKMRMKTKGFKNYVFECDDGVWTVTEKGDKSGKESDDKKELIAALLLDREIKSQAEIAFLVKCTQPNVSYTKSEYEHLFNKNGSCNKKGKSFLTEHRDILDDFYEEREINNG